MRLTATIGALVLLWSAVGASPALAETCQAHPSDRIADDLFAKLKSADVSGAIDATLGQSALLAGRQAELGALAKQIDASFSAYGAITHYECARQETFSSLMIYREYVAQHEKMLTRWKMIFTKLPDGWTTVQLSYDDQIIEWGD